MYFRVYNARNSKISEQHMDNPRSAIIIGSSGGIGAALTQRLISKNPGLRLITSSREASQKHASRQERYALDYQKPESIAQFAETCDGSLEFVDLVIFASGALAFDAWHPEKKLGHVNNQQLLQTYQINAAGPLTLFARLEPLLKRSSAPKVLFLSAQIGSIGDNQSGGWLAYRMAKSALNMGVKTIAIEVQRWRNAPVVVAVHPGTTKTALSAPFISNRRGKVKSADQTSIELLALAGTLQVRDNGKFLTSTGGEIEW